MMIVLLWLCALLAISFVFVGVFLLGGRGWEESVRISSMIQSDEKIILFI